MRAGSTAANGSATLNQVGALEQTADLADTETSALSVDGATFDFDGVAATWWPWCACPSWAWTADGAT